jgi:hypothetical protein
VTSSLKRRVLDVVNIADHPVLYLAAGWLVLFPALVVVAVTADMWIVAMLFVALVGCTVAIGLMIDRRRSSS